MMAIMNEYKCSKCGVRLADGVAVCPQCGTQRGANGSKPKAGLVHAEVRTEPRNTTCVNCGADIEPDDLFCEKCGADQAEPQQSAGLAQVPQDAAPQGSSGKKKVAFPAPAYASPLSSARKKGGKNSILLPLIALLAIVWIGGMGFLAYKFFIEKDDSRGVQTTIITGQDGEEASDDSAVSMDVPQDDPLPSSPPQAEFIWGAQDSRGYSKLTPSDPSRVSAGTPALSAVVLGDRVRMRAEPNTDGKIIHHYSKGARVEVLRRYNSGKEEYPWYNIRVRGQSGWMYGQYVGEIK
jgi:DNA-directed RNA polymerase subunit RPC12/RpoP/uncharacterized protein YgiM (DUF1202 family)